MNPKRRLSASVDRELLEAAETAVKAGFATSVSAWVNDAFRRQIDHERRIVAMDTYLGAFEAEFGEISEAEMAEATKRTRASAVVVRSGPVTRVRKRRSA
jgi:hypothetical protein